MKSLVKPALVLLLSVLTFLPAFGDEYTGDTYEDLFAVARNAIVETSGPLAIYHWTDTLKSSGDVYEENAMHATFEFAGKKTETIGPGYYFASDPLATRIFAGDHWTVFEKVLKPRTKLMDIRTWKTASFSKELRKRLKSQYKCSAAALGELFQFSQKRGCFDLKKRLLLDPRYRDVVGLVYPYHSFGFDRCAQESGKTLYEDQGVAFLIWSANAFAPESVLMQWGKDLDSKPVGRLEALFEEKVSFYTTDVPGRDQYPAQNAPNRPSDRELNAWMRKYLWACRSGL